LETFGRKNLTRGELNIKIYLKVLWCEDADWIKLAYNE